MALRIKKSRFDKCFSVSVEKEYERDPYVSVKWSVFDIKILVYEIYLFFKPYIWDVGEFSCWWWRWWQRWFHFISILQLTHLPLVPHICVIELDQHWSRWWLVAFSAPSHYLNQYWTIVNWTLRSKLQWNQNAKLFIHENAYENIVCKMVAILSKGRWVNTWVCLGPHTGFLLGLIIRMYCIDYVMNSGLCII